MTLLASGGAPAAPSLADPRVASRVPPPAGLFWILKLLAVAIGTTIAVHAASRYPPAGVTGGVIAGLAGCLALRLGQGRPQDWTYWVATALAGAAGTLVLGGLVGARGTGPASSWVVVLSVSFAGTLAMWHALEGAVSMRSIVTARREAFHWLAIGLAFALGVSVEVLVTRSLGIGYLATAGLFGAAAALVALAHARLWLDSTVAFWSAYVLTCPLGAALSHLLVLGRAEGGLGLGPMLTIVLCFNAIVLALMLAAAEHRVLAGSPERDET